MNSFGLTLDKLFSAGPNVIFGPLDILLALSVSTVLCFLIALVYRITHRGSTYSVSYVNALFIMTVTTSVIMLVIGSNIARAFSLVGALSVIRFRTAVKDSRDTGFLFAGVAVGMACGTGFYTVAVIFTLFFCCLMLALYYTEFGRRPPSKNLVLRVMHKDDSAVEDQVRASIESACKGVLLLNRMTDVSSSLITSIYQVESDKEKVAGVEAALRGIAGVEKITYFQSHQSTLTY